MPRFGDLTDIEAVLQHIGETGVLPEPYADGPGRLFLAIHDQWVENGGKVSGKRRNSMRQLMDLLEAAGTPVASLRSKLNGETRLRREDASALLDVYFSKWWFELADGGRGRYAVHGFDRLDNVCDVMLRSLFGDKKAVLLPEFEKSQKAKSKSTIAKRNDSALFLAGRDVIPGTFRSSRAVITISRVGSVAGPNTAAAIRGFCKTIDDWWRIALEDKLERTLVWIVDPGDRDINNDDSLAAFANAEQLATFFRAVRLMNDPDAEARWSWLSTHAAVLVGSMDVAVTNRLYASELGKLDGTERKENPTSTGIKYSHFLLDAYPHSWLRSLQFAQLYGEDFEDLERSSFMIWLDETETLWRYFGYAPATSPILARDGTLSFTKFLELASPGSIYDRAAATVHAGACFRLKLKKSNISEDEALQSVMTLRHLDFAVFRLSEFLNADNLSKRQALIYDS